METKWKHNGNKMKTKGKQKEHWINKKQKNKQNEHKMDTQWIQN